MKFSIIVVCLNPGEKLKNTMDSILEQTCRDFEVIIKDGGSTDGSVESWRLSAEMDGSVKPEDHSSELNGTKVRFFQEKDKGIYDAMNQAVSHAAGDFVLFMNCGDRFADEKVLERTAECMEAKHEAGADMDRLVLYGDTFSEKNSVTIASASKITGFTCYRNIPCHQSCLYSAALCREKPYDLQYQIRADYDHFLWCFYRAGAQFQHMGFPVASYEGGGYSESRENRNRDKQEHEQITKTYMGRGELLGYKAVMACTLAPLRRAMAESRIFSGAYHWLKERVYQRKFWILAAVVLFFAEMALLVWPAGWLGEEKVNYLTGEGSWGLETSEGNIGYCQEFSPEYRHVKSIGIVATTEGLPLGSGEMSVVITDSTGQLLFQQKIPYGQLILDTYQDITLNLLLKPGAKYYLTVNFGNNDAEGITPLLMVCGTQYFMPENISLISDEPVSDIQLLTRYVYEDAISKVKFFRVLFLCSITALGLAIGLPENKKFRRVVGVLLLVVGPYVLVQRLELLTINTTLLLPFSLKWSVGLIYLLEIILLLCTQSIRFSLGFSNILLTLVYSVNYYKHVFRGEPLQLNDIYAMKTAAQVVGNYNLRPNSHLAMAWCIALLLFLLAMQTGVRRKVEKKSRRIVSHLVSLGMGVMLTGISGYIFLYTNFFLNQGFIYFEGISWDMSYSCDGFLVGTFLNIQDGIKYSKIILPDGYSAEMVEEFLAEAERNPSEIIDSQLPHIILIMNESFADLRVLGNLQISQENLPFFNSLTENTVRGYVNASVFGGGTANTEFEVLTGCTMAFLPTGSYAYQQYIKQSIPSVVSFLADAGYTSYSIHPGSRVSWNRDRVYQYMGFDYSLWAADLRASSDIGTYEKIVELFENRQDGEKIFVFDVTIQNHGGYLESRVEQTISALNVSYVEVDNYLSLIYASDKAFEWLVSYFEQQDEPVMICMFGDHHPKISDDSFYDSIYAQTEGLTEIDNRLNMYKTPFVIWANYDISEEEGLDIGMSYLGTLLLDIAKVPVSPYFSFLRQYMVEYPIVSVNGYEDKDGNHHEWSGNNTELIEYRMLQYNYLFDR